MSDDSLPQPPLVTPPELPSAPEVPSARLYRVSGIGLGTFLGSPLAGGILLAVNARRQGDASAARRDLLLFAAITAGLLAIAFCDWLFPGHTLLEILVRTGGIAALGATIAYARRVQGDRIVRHMSLGGQAESNWKAAGIGVASLLAVMAMLVLVGGILVFGGAVNMDNDGNVVHALPTPAEITPAPGWVVVENKTENDGASYGIKRFRHGMQEASVMLQVGASDDTPLKDAFDDVVQQIDGQMPSSPIDEQEPVEFRINGKPALRSDATYEVDGARVRQQRVMTYGDRKACILEYTAREDAFGTNQADAEAIRDSLKCP